MKTNSSEPRKKSIDSLLLVWIFLAALLLRILWLVQYQQSPSFSYPLLDFTFFQERAYEILNGRFFSDGYLFNPLYPIFLAGVFAVFGGDLFFPRLVQVLLGSFNVLLVYRLGRHAFGRPAAVAAALLTAVYLPLIYFDGILMATSLITFLILVTVNILVSAQHRQSVAWSAAGGLGMGAVILGRPNFLIVALAIALWLATLTPRTAPVRRLAMGILFLAGLSAVISPITLHHWNTHREFIIVAPHGGINFYIGNNPDATGTYYSVPGISDNPGTQVRDSIDIVSQKLGHPASAPEASSYWMHQSMQFMKTDPAGFFRLFLRKIALFWNKSELPSEYSIDFDSRFHSILRLPLPW
ncbi:MAG TPA: glycosyltransferase family 39 protein, partial [bacterium]|nr:glycosyltransferase family 39 protein [bacterium]